MIVDFIQFGLRHSELVGALVVALSTLIGIALYGRAIGSQARSPRQIVQLINQDSPLIFDLRGPTQFRQGWIKGAKHVTYEACLKALQSVSPDTALIIVSSASSGVPPYKLSRYLRVRKFARFYHIAGGLRAWQSANLPLVQS